MSESFTPDQWKQYFEEHDLPKGLRLYPGTTITDPVIFVATQINLYQHYGNAGVRKICLERMIRVKEILETNPTT